MSKPEYELSGLMKTPRKPLTLAEVMQAAQSRRGGVPPAAQGPDPFTAQMNALKQTQDVLTLGGLLSPKNIKEFLIGHPERLANPTGSVTFEDLGGNIVGVPNWLAGGVDAAMALPLIGSSLRVGRGVAREAKPFFSALTRSIAERAPERAAAEQFLNIARKGAKAEELEWSGLESFLRAAGPRPLPKRDVLDYLEKNLPELREHFIGTKYTVVNKNGIRKGVFNSKSEAEKFIADLGGRSGEYSAIVEPANRPKFTSYTLPGGENQRELVVTMPAKKVAKKQENLSPGELGEMAAYEEGFDLGNEGQRTLQEGGNYQVPSGHAYGDPELDVNRLFHARMNDRDGGKTLFMEELQSDWHQAGRKEGYAEAKPTATPRLPDDLEFRRATQADVNAFYENPALPGNANANDWMLFDRIGEPLTVVPGNVAEAQARQQAAEDFQDIVDVPSSMKGVPDAPFKNTWQELGMRRMLQEAAEGGYERLAWTTGKQQAERYSLSQHLSKIMYDKSTGQFIGYNRTGEPVVDQIVKQEALSDMIGDDAAKKLLASEPIDGGALYDVNQRNIGRSQLHVLEGQDLDIGGEGMRGFYDKILPQYVNKWAKKYGGKIEKHAIETGGFEDFDGDPINEDRLQALIGQHRNRILDMEIENINDMSDEDLMDWFTSAGHKESEFDTDWKSSSRANYIRHLLERDAERSVIKMNNKEIIDELVDIGEISPRKEEVWSIELTPEMRKAILDEGQPLFAVPLVAPRRPEEQDTEPKSLRDLMYLEATRRHARDRQRQP